MYKHNEKQMILPEEFFLPFGGKLNPENRWCKLAALIPWSEEEDRYAKSFRNLGNGNEAFSVRMALGSLIIQNHEPFSDRKLVEHITENAYMQFFIGLHRYLEKPPFNPSLLVYFRKRLGKDIINEINEMIAKPDITKSDDWYDTGGGGSSDNPDAAADESQEKNAGKLILDATYALADVHYPTDIWLLNEVREALEEIVDVLHAPHVGTSMKPRTYRERARRRYISLAKKKRPTPDLATIQQIAQKSPLALLSKQQYRDLLVTHEIYRQQLWMYQYKEHKVEEWIVNLHMLFVRPIVRGKTNAVVEFGAKLSISIVDGNTNME